MKVTREEVLKLAMRADINGQVTLGANLRDAAACFDYNRIKEVKGKIDWRSIDLKERRILLSIDEIHQGSDQFDE